jgi:microcystin degradation protein MlrC
MGDNIGGGSAGDGAVVLAELLRQNAQGWVVVLADPEAAALATRIGVGGALRALVGGRRDGLHGDPVEIAGNVRFVYDGKYIEPETRHGGQRFHDQGPSAVIEVGHGDPPNLLLLTTLREPPFSLQQLVSAGIRPERQRILVVKAAVAFRAAYEPIAGDIIEVDTPGLTAVNPARFEYRHVRRPMWGLDPL